MNDELKTEVKKVIQDVLEWNELKAEMKDLVQDVLEWMMDNDYECGSYGSVLYSRLNEVKKKLELPKNNS